MEGKKKNWKKEGKRRSMHEKEWVHSHTKGNPSAIHAGEGDSSEIKEKGVGFKFGKVVFSIYVWMWGVEWSPDKIKGGLEVWNRPPGGINGGPVPDPWCPLCPSMARKPSRSELNPWRSEDERTSEQKSEGTRPKNNRKRRKEIQIRFYCSELPLFYCSEMKIRFKFSFEISNRKNTRQNRAYLKGFSTRFQNIHPNHHSLLYLHLLFPLQTEAQKPYKEILCEDSNSSLQEESGKEKTEKKSEVMKGNPYAREEGSRSEMKNSFMPFDKCLRWNEKRKVIPLYLIWIAFRHVRFTGNLIKEPELREKMDLDRIDKRTVSSTYYRRSTRMKIRNLKVEFRKENVVSKLLELAYTWMGITRKLNDKCLIWKGKWKYFPLSLIWSAGLFARGNKNLRTELELEEIKKLNNSGKRPKRSIYYKNWTRESILKPQATHENENKLYHIYELIYAWTGLTMISSYHEQVCKTKTTTQRDILRAQEHQDIRTTKRRQKMETKRTTKEKRKQGKSEDRRRGKNNKSLKNKTKAYDSQIDAY